MPSLVMELSPTQVQTFSPVAGLSEQEPSAITEHKIVEAKGEAVKRPVQKGKDGKGTERPQGSWLSWYNTRYVQFLQGTVIMVGIGSAHQGRLHKKGGREGSSKQWFLGFCKSTAAKEQH